MTFLEEASRNKEIRVHTAYYNFLHDQTTVSKIALSQKAALIMVICACYLDYKFRVLLVGFVSRFDTSFVLGQVQSLLRLPFAPVSQLFGRLLQLLYTLSSTL